QNIQKCLDQQLTMLDKSIRYSYAYLFKTERAPQERIFDNRQVQIRDFYNLAIAHLIQRYAERYKTKQSGQRIQVGDSVYTIDLENFPQLKNQTIEQRSEEHTSELQSRENLVCRLLLEEKKNFNIAKVIIS